MAERRASMFGTEKDQQNCPFYLKIGACRHGDRCSRLHNKPVISNTLILPNLYQSPYLRRGQNQPPIQATQEEIQKHFDEFYEDIYEGLAKYGKVELLHVCANLGDHLIGNVYVKYDLEQSAAAAVEGLRGRFYDGRPLVAEFSPVADFNESRCRQFDMGTCDRGGYCNFMHLHLPSKSLSIKLFGESRSRSPSPGRGDRPAGRGGRGRYNDYHGGGGRDRYNPYGRGGDRGGDYRGGGDRYRDRDYRDGDRYRGDRDYREGDRYRGDYGRDDYYRRGDRDYEPRGDGYKREPRSPPHGVPPPPPANGEYSIPPSIMASIEAEKIKLESNPSVGAPTGEYNPPPTGGDLSSLPPPSAAPTSAESQTIQWATSDERRTTDYTVNTSLTTVEQPLISTNDISVPPPPPQV